MSLPSSVNMLSGMACGICNTGGQRFSETKKNKSLKKP